MSDNPLKHYFRRPAIYIKLPSGGVNYDRAVVEPTQTGELPVYPMSAIDEITARTPDALFNGQAVVDIIKSCIPAIKDPWQILSNDLDAILIAIRIASSGESMDILCNCQKCNAENKFGINMIQMLASRQNVTFDKSIKVRDIEVKFKALTFSEINKTNIAQYDVQRMIAEMEILEDAEEKARLSKIAVDTIGNLTAEILSATIEHVATPDVTVTDKVHIKEFLDNCDRQTSNQIKEFSAKIREDNALPPLNVKCIECGHEFTTPLVLNYADFFA